MMSQAITAIELTDFSALNPAEVTDRLTVLAEILQEAQPTMELRRGVFYDLLLYADALLHTQLRQGVIDRYLSARSFLIAQADPALADAGVLAEIASNFGVTPGIAETASGAVTIVVDSDTGITVGNATVFTANGQTFSADASYSAVSEAGQVIDITTPLLIPLGNNQWAFQINVVALTAGSAGMLGKGTTLIPSPVPADFVQAYATNDFSGGADAASNANLIAQMASGVAAKIPGNRTNLRALLRANALFAGYVGDSAVGAGNAAMIRDKHSIFPGSLGGRIDWYVRPTLQISQVTLSLTATLLAINAGGVGVWVCNIDRDTAPGFYEIVSILLPTSPPTGSGLIVTADVRGFDLTVGTLTAGYSLPDIVSPIEAAYSRFQTSVVQFQDNITNYASLSVGATAVYNVTVSMLPQIDAIQDWLSQPENASLDSDILVKAPVPCFVGVYIRIAKTLLATSPDTAPLIAAVVASVNQAPFSGRLYAGAVQDAVAILLPGGMDVSAIELVGRIRSPDGKMRFITSTSVLAITDGNLLTVPDVPGAMVSAATVAFFTAPGQVQIEVVSEIPAAL